MGGRDNAQRRMQGPQECFLDGMELEGGLERTAGMRGEGHSRQREPLKGLRSSHGPEVFWGQFLSGYCYSIYREMQKVKD